MTKTWLRWSHYNCITSVRQLLKTAIWLWDDYIRANWFSQYFEPLGKFSLTTLSCQGSLDCTKIPLTKGIITEICDKAVRWPWTAMHSNFELVMCEGAYETSREKLKNVKNLSSRRSTHVHMSTTGWIMTKRLPPLPMEMHQWVVVLNFSTLWGSNRDFEWLELALPGETVIRFIFVAPNDEQRIKTQMSR